jgi:hypothetical protein
MAASKSERPTVQAMIDWERAGRALGIENAYAPTSPTATRRQGLILRLHWPRRGSSGQPPKVRPATEAECCRRVNFSSTSYVIAVGGLEMNPLLTLYFSGGMSFAGLGLLKLQARLERWAYERHAED